MSDETIVCKDCGEEFLFTVRDQEFYKEQGFANKPLRCKSCRDKKKAERNNRPYTERRTFETKENE